MSAMAFARTTQFLDGEGSAAMADLARVFRQLGLQFVRATVVEMESLAARAAWSITESGEVIDSPADRPIDSAFPGAADSVGGLAEASTEEMMMQRLSPGRWAYAWRLDDDHAVLAEAQYRERRDVNSEIDVAVIRLLCSASVRADARAERAVITPTPGPLQVWPHVDRRAPQPPSPASRLGVGLMLASALLAAAAALWLAPSANDVSREAQAQVAQFRRMSDATLAQDLATALATGDYGEVQAQLSRFRALDYFTSAVVVNDRGRIIASEGAPASARIGGDVPQDFAAASRAQPLVLGSVPQGRLFVQTAPVTQGGTGHGLVVACTIAALAAVTAAVLQFKGSLPPLDRWRVERRDARRNGSRGSRRNRRDG